MPNLELARVDWRTGQILRTEHFTALEGSVFAHLAARVGLLGLPLVGIAEVAWDEELLQTAGQLSIQKLTAVLPSGQLVEVGGNAVFDAPSVDLAAAGSRVAVQLHRHERAVPMRGEAVDRSAVRLSLSARVDVRGSAERMLLGVFEQGDDGWAVAKDRVPQLLSCWATPFLRPALQGLDDDLRAFRGRLQQELSIAYLSGTSQSALRTALKELYTFRALLADLGAGLEQHPHTVHMALRRLFFELFFHQGERDRIRPELAEQPYRHDDLAGSLFALVDAVRDIVGNRWQGPRFVSFVRDENRFQVDDLPQALQDAPEVYLVVRRPRVGAEFDPDKIKLASPKRLPTVHRLSLVGVPLLEAPLPSFARQLGPEVEVYKLELGEEWAHVLASSSVAFYLRNEEAGQYQASLWWTEA